ncbi:MAG: DUF3298 and DUF4163 domain-containing protein [Firmicutes bacterium]|nr:DUF3298 and DUF4163 domain-containing protein [Bacillota bacterium]
MRYYRSRIYHLGVILALLFCFAAMSSVGWGRELQAKPTLELKARTVSHETELVSGETKIPVIKGLEDSDLEKQLNERWARDISDFVDKVVVEAQAFADEFGEELSHWLPFEVAVDFQTGYLGERYVSIPIVYYSFTGGAHGFHYQLATNVDLHTGKDLTLQDLFTAGYDYRQAIRDEVLRQMQANPSIYFDEAMADSEIAPDHPFYLSAAGIVVYYGLYEVAPYCTGIPEFTIPFAYLWEGLQPAIQAIVTGR